MIMKQIKPFNPEDPDVRSKVERIMKAKPVRNLTYEEVITTLWYLYMKQEITEKQEYYTNQVVHRNDKRLEESSDDERFLAVLADCSCREVLLGTKRLRSLFGNTVYHWRKIARKCPIIETVSGFSECSAGYYGRGWIIAPHIERLIDWISEENL